jgi:hypothetical protein
MRKETGMKMKVLALFAAVALILSGTIKAGTTEDERAIKALKGVFAKAMENKDAKLRASIWAEDGTLVPPTGGFLRGRDAMIKVFLDRSGRGYR